jgi:hypothetical protein
MFAVSSGLSVSDSQTFVTRSISIVIAPSTQPSDGRWPVRYHACPSSASSSGTHEVRKPRPAALRYKDPKRAGRFADADFPDAGADARHWLPVVGIAPHLNPPKLMTGLTARTLRKTLDLPFRIAEPSKRLHVLYRF